jgi:hypothetical protein
MTTAATASTLTSIETTCGHGYSQTLITCCALALEIRPLCTVLSRRHADTIVARGRWQRTDEQVLRWRQLTFETSWHIQWAAARRVLRAFYPELPGVDEVPADHWAAGLPEIAAACVTDGLDTTL